ncbi:hypothetical protein [Sporomusa acidovorans]|uniref:Uncharacterized protein n=1 Tax=Sporomusa acidovorans (strain ATCC 49682 / DSM 3132 / Mol) TaxID=1123286 RepID=A0ABZ3J5C8_SPOA4|nr:hypothetical protein [Sporomusa acidovorans]OZC15398.1 hypothetical protein SPACI_49480 [Sporomusa acidovorans DSM 3132]SDF13390.1 hypothetical protein SAMN04488499_103425 [Sporomusa acidovorans]
MSLVIIDAREWQNMFDLKTGHKRNDDSPKVRMVKEVLHDHPFPGDTAENSNRWVTDTALDLVSRYDPNFVFLIYAQQYYSLRFEGPDEAERARLIDAAFAEAARFSEKSGFLPVVVGTGDLIPVKEYIDLSGLDGLAITSNWLTRYAGLYGVSCRDFEYIHEQPGVGRLVGKTEFMSLFGAEPVDAERLPEWLAVAKEGYCFRSTLLRRPVMIPAYNASIPVSRTLDEITSITGISGGIEAALQGKKVALILIEGVGIKDFRLPYIPCANGKGWFIYENGEAQYLTISTGRHQVFAYPPGYRSYLEDDENKGYPFSGYLTSIPSGTIGERSGGRSIAVGNRSMFMHTVTGADIAIECFARNLANQGCMGVIHR